MSRRAFLTAITLALVGATGRARAQKPAAAPTVGVLVTHAPLSDPVWVALREGFRNLGYAERRNLNLIILTAEGQLGRLPDLAAELLSRNADVIVAPNELAVRTAMKATKTVPIVMIGWGYDPVALGLVSSFSKPGGNITGLYWLPSELEGKRLEMLKEVLPRTSRVAVFWDAFGKHSLPALQGAAKSLDMRLIPIEVPAIEDLSAAIKEAKRRKADAGIFVWAPNFYVHRNRVAQLTTEAKLPAIHAVMQVVEAGGFLSYGPDGMDSFRRVAYYVDRILKGAKPAELPIEQVSELKFAVNLRAAKAMDIVIPESILARADKVIR